MPRKKSYRIHSYDFFRGILSLGFILLLTFLEFNSFFPEIFYRWVSLGFLFFSGLLVGEILWRKKTSFFFVRRGVQIIGIFLLINFFSFLPSFSELSFEVWKDISISLLQGNFSLLVSLLLPLGAFYIILPLFRYIPSFLGFFWGILGFLILDILSIEKDIFSLNGVFLMMTILGFFTGRLFSLDHFRNFIASKFVILPSLFLYLAFALLIVGVFQEEFYFTIFSPFWSFHFLILLLFFFAIPSSLFFVQGPQKSFSRIFFETIGVEMFFVYIFISIFLKGIHFIFPELSFSNGFDIFLLAIHLSILSFAIVSIVKKISQKSKNFKKYFRYLF